MSNTSPLITCSHCQATLEYCPGCGAIVRETYVDGKRCARCGSTLSHCTTCGKALEGWTNQVLELAPSAEKEFIRFCPACGKKIWDVTDQCPHCQVNVRAYMDRIYSLTYDRVNQITMEEEAQLTRGDDKDAWAKAKRRRSEDAIRSTIQQGIMILVLLAIAVFLLWVMRMVAV